MEKELKEKYKENISDIYLKYLGKYHKDPTRKEFNNWIIFTPEDAELGVTSWTQIFKNISEIRAYTMAKYPDRVKDFTFNESNFGTDEYLAEAQEAIKTHTRFVISTAVNNKPVNIEFLESLKNYAQANNAVLLWIPAHDVRSAKRVFEWNFDPALKCGYVITEDTVLNENCMISGITVSAKQINPLTGVIRFCSMQDKSIIYPGCKQMLNRIATYNDENITPHMATCPGAVTVPDYSSDKIISGRTNYIAERDHQLGAVIVELEDNKRFHPRHVQAAEDGSFTDLGIVYHPDGTITKSRNATLVLGDSHVGSHDVQLLGAICTLLRDSDFVTELVLHDIDNSSAVSHHEANDFVQRAIRAKNGSDDLVEEINNVVKYLNDFTMLPNMSLTIVNSNHDRHIERYIREGRAFSQRDFKNMPAALDLMNAFINKNIKNPVQYLVENTATVKLEHPERIKWLGQDESYRKYGVELGFHGDSGANGCKGTLRTFENSLYNAVVAHSHTGAIQRMIFQVGTTSEKNMGYNHGLSSWTRTCCLVYEDGTKQLIDFLPNKAGGYTYRA